MPRGIPWDDLPKRYTLGKKPEDTPAAPREVDLTPEETDFQKDAIEIGKRIVFGSVCGFITGATFGFVDVLRDAKAMSAKTQVGTAKVLRFGYMFAGFFGSYHGVRKVLKLYNPQPPEVNVLMAAVMCISPLIVVPKLRPLIPYSIMLVGLDALNGINDI